jgi:hypothetical protein
MESVRSARSTLLEKALSLPIAGRSDFVGKHHPPSGADPTHLRIINDTALRSRLIMAGLAEGIQSPKGPQRIASIIRLYPNFDAPGRDERMAGTGRRPGRPRRSETLEASPSARGASELPTVEELNALLGRIHATEIDVSREFQGKLNQDIDRLKREIGHLEGDAFERTFRELQNAIETRRSLAGKIREEAFQRIEADAAFAPRRYLRMIGRHRETDG